MSGGAATPPTAGLGAAGVGHGASERPAERDADVLLRAGLGPLLLLDRLAGGGRGGAAAARRHRGRALCRGAARPLAVERTHKRGAAAPSWRVPDRRRSARSSSASTLFATDDDMVGAVGEAPPSARRAAAAVGDAHDAARGRRGISGCDARHRAQGTRSSRRVLKQRSPPESCSGRAATIGATYESGSAARRATSAAKASPVALQAAHTDGNLLDVGEKCSSATAREARARLMAGGDQAGWLQALAKVDAKIKPPPTPPARRRSSARCRVGADVASARRRRADALRRGHVARGAPSSRASPSARETRRACPGAVRDAATPRRPLRASARRPGRTTPPPACFGGRRGGGTCAGGGAGGAGDAKVRSPRGTGCQRCRTRARPRGAVA